MTPQANDFVALFPTSCINSGSAPLFLEKMQTPSR
jgi:hypothetical protein